MSMPDDDPEKMVEVRRLSAIYGTSNGKRNPEKPLTLYQVRKLFSDFEIFKMSS